MIKRVRNGALGLIAAVVVGQALPAQNRGMSIAIADFRNSTGRFVNDRLEKTVPELLKTELAQTGALTVVERGRLEAIFNEQALGQSGVLDTYEAQKVGKLVGAQYVISGELTRTGDRFRVDAHIVRVETGEVVGEKVTGPDEGAVEAMIRILARNIAHNLTGQGQTISQAPVRRYPYQWPLLGAVGAGIAAGILHAQYEKHYDAYRDGRSLDLIARSYEDAEKNYRARNYALGAGALLLTAGATLWLKSRHRGNIIFAEDKRFMSGRLVVSPSVDPYHRQITLTLAWIY